MTTTLAGRGSVDENHGQFFQIQLAARMLSEALERYVRVDAGGEESVKTKSQTSGSGNGTGGYNGVSGAYGDNEDRDLTITPCQAEVLRMWGEGRQAKDIAISRNCSVHTVSNHLKLAKARLGVHGSSYEAFLVARRADLL